MSNIPISSLPVANPLTGEETVPIVQAGTTKRTTSGAISNLPNGSGSGIAFVTVGSATTALPNSRQLSAASPVLLTDGGAGGAITVSLAFTPGTGTVTSVGLSGGTTGITVSNSPITSNGTMTLGGVLGVSNGGSGTSAITANSVLIGDTTGSSITRIANATAGYVLTSTGLASAPTFQAAGSGTIASVSMGGTGTSALTAHGVLLGNGTSPVTISAVGTAGQLFVGQGAASDPLWKTPSGDLALSSTGVATVGNALGHSILNLPLTTGLVVATSATTATQRSIGAGAGITVTNSDGSSGNPTVALSTIAGLSILGVAGTGTSTPAAITGAAGQFLGVNSGGTALAFATAVVTVKKQAFTANGTYTPSTGMLFCLSEGVGAGGGGGGVAGTASAIFIAGGGGSGAYSRALLTAAQIGASKTVTIGAGGAGGASGANNGTVGGDTSLGTLLVAKGGSGGSASSVAAVGGGGAGGLASGGTGDITADGNPGGAGFYNTVNTAILLLTGLGGASYFGGGAPAAANAGGASPGMPGKNYGGGGSGGLVNNSVVNTNGGTGSAGVLYITEWCSQ